MAVIYALLEVHLNNVHKLFVRKKYSNHRRNRHYFSANGPFLLLPLALKWGLFLLGFVFILPCLCSQCVSAASITLELSPSDGLSLPVSPDGKLHETETPGTIKVTSNAYSGYTLTIKGSDDSKQLKNGDATFISSIGSALEPSVYKDAGNMNTWGYLPNKLNSDPNTAYQPGPTETPVIIDSTNPQSTKQETIQYTITLGAKLDYDTIPGTYSSTFTLTLTANDLHYTINYDGNGTGVVNMPEQLSGNAAEGKVLKIDEKIPTREGYGFRGWCDTKTSDEKCTSTMYWPGTSYSLVNGDNTLNLYAMWINTTTMQDWTGCPTLEEEETTYLTDIRDNNTYAVTKLKDGLCWMTENLRIGSNGTETILTANTTDIDSETLIDNEEKAGVFTLPSGTQEPDSWYHFLFNTKQIWISNDSQHAREYGGYYNWFTATAGGGKGDLADVDVSHSICPKGWRLPKREEIVTVTNNDNNLSPNKVLGNFTVYASFCDEGGCPVRGSGLPGRWWSSTAYNNSNLAHDMRASDTIFIRDQNSKGRGEAVRCVVRQ